MAILDLIALSSYCIRATNKTNEILTKHNDWTKSCDKVMKRLSLDYSKPSSWGVDTLKMRIVSIKSCWDKGRVQKEEFLQNSECKELEEMGFFALSSSQSISLLKPKGKNIGVSDRKVSDDVEVGDSDEFKNDFELVEDDQADSSTMIDFLEESDRSGKVHDSIIDVDGVLFHKASVLKQTFVRVKVLKDRLRSVQGLSKTMGKKEDLNLDKSYHKR